MPQILRHIELIAQEKQRTVLLIRFGPKRKQGELPSSINAWPASMKAKRDHLVVWLGENALGYEECFPAVALDCIEFPYDGTLYVDLVFDVTNPAYQTFISRLENADGTPRDPEVVCFYMTLEQALKKIGQANRNAD